MLQFSRSYVLQQKPARTCGSYPHCFGIVRIKGQPDRVYVRRMGAQPCDRFKSVHNGHAKIYDGNIRITLFTHGRYELFTMCCQYGYRIAMQPIDHVGQAVPDHFVVIDYRYGLRHL